MARTSAGSTPPSPANQRICTRCGRAVAATSVRCRFCMADLRRVATEGPVQPMGARRRRRLPQIRHRWTRRRGFAVVFTVLVLAYIGDWAWVHHISTPEPLPLGASPAISLVETPTAAWPTANGGLGQTRATTASPAIGGGAGEAWRVELSDWVLRAPVADGERIYVTFRDTLGAYSLDDGGEVWREAWAGLLSAPAVVGDRLYLALRNGRVFAIDSATGELEWTTILAEELFSTPIAFRGVLYVYAPGRLHGIDAETGDRLWSRDIEGNWGESPPVVNEERVAVAARKAVVVLDRATGQRTFRHPHTSVAGLLFGAEFIHSVSPAFAAGIDPASTLPWWEGTRLYWNWLWAFGAAPAPPRPEVEWVSRERPSELRSGTAFTLMFSPAYDGRRIITSDATGLVRAFDGTTGVMAWEAELDAVHGPPTVTPDGVLVPLGDGLVLLDLETGETLAERSLDAVGSRVDRWAVVLERGTIVVDAPGAMLVLR